MRAGVRRWDSTRAWLAGDACTYGARSGGLDVRATRDAGCGRSFTRWQRQGAGKTGAAADGEPSV